MSNLLKMIIVWIALVALVVVTFFRWPSSRESANIVASKDGDLNRYVRWLDINQPDGVDSQIHDKDVNENHKKIVRESRGIEQESEKVVQEIQMRLNHEHDLFLYQFILMGGVFAVFLGTHGLFSNRQSGDDSKSEGEKLQQNDGTVIEKLYENGSLFLAFGAIALTLLIVDIHIRFNALVIQSLGTWIRVHYEYWNVCPAIGWELFWSSSQNENFCHADSILYMMLYLPTIGTLLAFYAMLFCEQKKLQRTPMFLKAVIFLGVQMGLFLFAIINRWPVFSMGVGDWILTVTWFLLFIYISVCGWLKLY